MKLQSLVVLFKNLLFLLKDTVSRFYLSLISAVLATSIIVWRIWTNMDFNEIPEYVNKVLVCALFGILLFAAFSLLVEKYKLRKWLPVLIGVPLLYFFLYRVDQNIKELFMIHVFVFFISTVCLFLSVPYFTNSKEKYFWSFAFQTVYAVCIAIASVLILTGGFNLALYSVETLFEVNISDKYYATLSTVLPILCGSLIFLSGIPSDFKMEIKKSLLTKSLKFFAYYLSFPLLVTYFLILATYSAKILVTWNWPNGFVATPILAFSMIGLFTYALTTPLREDDEFKSIRLFSKAFFWLLIPLLFVYFMGFWQRISAYGITENRYFGVLIGAWLVALSLYFGIYKKANLRVITISVFVLGLLSLVGPFSTFNISKASQLGRLENILDSNGMIENGQIIVFENPSLSSEDLMQVSAIFDYMYARHGLEPILDMFADPSLILGQKKY